MNCIEGKGALKTFGVFHIGTQQLFLYYKTSFNLNDFTKNIWPHFKGKNTVYENVIAASKMRNNFLLHTTVLNFIFIPILLSQYLTFLYCFSYSFRSSNFVIVKFVAINIFASLLVSILYIAKSSWILSISRLR